MGEPIKNILTKRYQTTDTLPEKTSAPISPTAMDFLGTAQNGYSFFSPAPVNPVYPASAPPSAHTLGTARNLEGPDFESLSARSLKIAPLPRTPQGHFSFMDSLQIIAPSQKIPESPAILVEIPPELTGWVKWIADTRDSYYKFTRQTGVNSMVGLGSHLLGGQYPFENEFGPLTYSSSITQFLPTNVRIHAGPFGVTFGGSLQKIVMEHETPIEAFHRTGGYFVGLMGEDLPLSADQLASEGFYTRREDKTRTFVTQAIFAQLAFVFASVQMGHYAGSPKFEKDILGDSVLNHSVTNYQGKRIDPTYSRPFFNDNFLSLSLDYGQVLGFGAGIKAHWQYMGWDEDIQDPISQEPIKRFWFWVDMHNTVGG